MNAERRPRSGGDGARADATNVDARIPDPALFSVSDDGRVVPNAETAQAARETGVALVEGASDDWARAVVDQAIRAAAESGRSFSANDLRDLLPAERSGLIGARFLAAAKAGRIIRVGYTPATHAAGHGRPVAVWAQAPTTAAGVR